MGDELRACVVEIEGWGWIGLVASERGLRMLWLPDPRREAALKAIRAYYPDAPLTAHDSMLEEAARQIRAYLLGELREFSVPLDLRGHTPFALAVWAATSRIGYGQTRSYRWVAEEVGAASAGIYQAVGSALGANPVPLIIPCHRVIGSDGSLTGYAGGVDMKARLLAMESGQAALPGI